MKALCTLLHELKFQTIDFQWNQLYEKKMWNFNLMCMFSKKLICDRYIAICQLT